MSATSLAWAALGGMLVLFSMGRSVWAVALYLMTFFAAPQLWWWGNELPEMRYQFWAGIVLLGAVLWSLSRSSEDAGRRFTWTHAAAVGIALNATMVNFVLASDPVTSGEDWIELLKFVLLFFLMWGAVQNRRDYRVALLAMALGAAYIGYEVTINERGDFNGARLENVGAPGADDANSLANLMLLTLPLIGSLFASSTIREKLIVITGAPLALNVLLLCNSRGAFLGLIGAGFTFLLIARGPMRKKAVRALLLGSVALYLLLGDPKILDRFSTTFVGSEERDASAASRFQFWEAGLRMVADYPLGAGGGSFKYVHGARYLGQVTGADESSRSLHNGYLTEATDWGIQGLFLKLLFFGGAIAAGFRTSNRCRVEGRLDDALMGICVLASALAFLIHCLFGSFLSNEWAYWVVALLVRYSEIYQTADSAATSSIPETSASHASPAAA
jgi:hypothetical protein